MSGATTSIGEMVARIGIASARYELYERLAHKALQKCTPEQVLALLKELKIEQYERNMPKMSDKLSNKTCGECRIYDHFHNLCVIGGDIEPTETAKGCFEPKVITNGDMIRQFSNKQLAELIENCGDECGGHMCKYCDSDNCSGQSCVDGIEAWLNAPAESEGEDEL